jgi:hypothetical protein
MAREPIASSYEFASPDGPFGNHEFLKRPRKPRLSSCAAIHPDGGAIARFAAG